MFYKKFVKKTLFICFLSLTIFILNCAAQNEKIIADNNCEVIKSSLEILGQTISSNNPDSYIAKNLYEMPVIVIARLGAKEKFDVYNTRRLDAIKSIYFSRYLHGYAPPIFASGEKMKDGKGRVEIYFGGIMQFAITADYNRNLRNCFSLKYAEG